MWKGVLDSWEGTIMEENRILDLGAVPQGGKPGPRQ